MALRADEEAEIMAARHSCYLDFLRERHAHRHAILLSLLSERPHITITCVCRGHIQVSPTRDRVHLLPYLRKEVYFRRHVDVIEMTESELTFIIGAPAYEFICVTGEDKRPISNGQNLSRFRALYPGSSSCGCVKPVWIIQGPV